MLIVHVHIKGKNGSIERSYDFMRNDDEDQLSGIDVIIPYDEKYEYPLDEDAAVVLVANKGLRTNH